jgi:hypothetical protein
MAHYLNLMAADVSPADRQLQLTNNTVPVGPPPDEIDTVRLLNGDTYGWDGTSWALTNGTEWNLAGTTTDAHQTKTASISRTGKVSVGGTATDVPLTTVDVIGSFSNQHRFTNLATNTFTDTDTVLSIGNGAGATATAVLPNATLFPRRYVTVKTAMDNPTTVVTVSSLGGLIESPYDGLSTGSKVLSHSTIKSATWQSDGTNWQLVAENSSVATGTEWNLTGTTTDAFGNKIAKLHREGGIKIGGIAPQTVGDVLSPVPTNQPVQLNAANASRGQLMYGTAPLSYVTQRLLPAALNSTVTLGSFLGDIAPPFSATSANSMPIVRISAGCLNPGIAVSGDWTLTPKWNENPAWQVCPPDHTSGPYLGETFELNYRTNSGTLEVRFRRKGGVTGTSLHVRIEAMDAGTNTFTESAVAGTDPAILVTKGFAPGSPAQVVDVTGLTLPQTSPSSFTGGVFAPNFPAVSDAVIYTLDDGTTWIYNGTQYVSAPAPIPSTEWNIAGTVNDAGGNKVAKITRQGGIKIGGVAPQTLTNVLSPVPVNEPLCLNDMTASRGQIMYGTEPLSYATQRTLPVVVNNWVSLGSFAATFDLAATPTPVAVRITMATYSLGGTNSYTWHLHPGNNQTASAWTVCPPDFGTGPYDSGSGIQDYELNFRTGPYSAGPAHVTDVRIRRKTGTAPGTAHFRIEALGAGSNTFTESVTTGTDPAVLPVKSFAFAADFWRSGAGLIQPDGTTDTTESISRLGAVGIGTNTPASTFSLVGSFERAWNQISISGATYNLTNADFGLLIQATATTATVNLPNANTCLNREYLVMLAGTNAQSVVTLNGGGSEIRGFGHITSPNLTLKHGSVRAVHLKSDGTVWQIDSYTEERFFYTGTYLAIGTGARIWTTNTGGVTGGVINPNVNVFQQLDGNYSPTVTLNPAPTALTLSVHADNSAGFPTTILAVNTDLPHTVVMPSGLGLSMHFVWSDGLWRWVHAPEAPQIQPPVSAIRGTYAVPLTGAVAWLPADGTVVVAAGSTVGPLPPAAQQKGRQYVIKKASTVGTVTVTPTAGELIDGLATATLPNSRQSITVQSTGTDWVII